MSGERSVPKIFLSYSHDDADRIATIIAALRARGWTVTYDDHLSAGEEWRQVLEGRISAAFGVVVVWSHRSVASDEVKAEAAAGLAQGRLYPLKIDHPLEIPPRFGHLHASNLSRWTGNPDDPLFIEALRHLEFEWQTGPGGMALIREITPLRPLRFRK